MRCVRHRTSGHHSTGDAPGVPFVSVTDEYAGQRALVVAVHNIGRRHGLATVHAHIQWPGLPITEPPLDPVKLWRGDTQVEQETDQVGHTGTIQYGAKVSEGSPVQFDPVTKRGQPGGAGCQRLVIAVDSKDLKIASRRQDGFGMTSTTNRRIQYDTGGHVSQSLQNLGHHYWLMLKAGRPLPDVLPALFRHGPVRRSVDLNEDGPGSPSLDRPPTGGRPSGCLPESG